MCPPESIRRRHPGWERRCNTCRLLIVTQLAKLPQDIVAWLNRRNRKTLFRDSSRYLKHPVSPVGSLVHHALNFFQKSRLVFSAKFELDATGVFFRLA